jgi:hypothetical protein
VSLLGQVKRGRIAAPIKALVYGVEGVGKSTLGAGLPEPLFICAESGTEQLDVARLPEPRAWSEVLGALDELAAGGHGYQSVVVDTVDWLEPLLWDHLCTKHKWSSIEAPGYGKGYVEALSEWRQLLRRLDQVRAAGLHVLLLAHATVRRVSPPDLEAYDRYSLKVNEKAAALVREWADAVLFAQYEVSTAKGRTDRVAKAYSTGERVLRTVYSASWDAKNRWGLPETVPLDAHVLLRAAAGAGAAAQPGELARELVEALEAVDDKAWGDKLRGWVLQQRDREAATAKALARVRDKLQEEDHR